MKKDVILVPLDSCPLDVLSELGDRTSSAWIFMHKNAIKHLINIADSHREHHFHGFIELYWKGTKDFPQTYVTTEYKRDNIWVKVLSIDANDIAFREPSDDPNEIFFLQMEE